MSSYIRNVFLDFAAALSPMAPGNMKSDIIGLQQRSKLNGKSFATRKLYVKNNDGPPLEPVSLANKMEQPQRGRDTLLNNAPDSDPSVVMNATAMSDVSNVAQSDHTKEMLIEGDGRCVVPENIGSLNKVNGEISHLKVLSMLHLDVIEQQQRQIQNSEREVQRLRAENETLKCRLERMNRRTHLAEKSEQNSTNQRGSVRQRKPIDSPLQKRKRRSDQDSLVNSPSRSATKETPAKSTSGLRENKDILSSSGTSQTNSVELNKRQRRSEKLSKKDEKKGANRQDSKESKESKEEEKYHRTDVMYPCLSDLRVHQPDPDFPDEDTVVMVPSWRVVTNQTGSCSDGSEECDDASFERRHCRLEQDERKRKRWDIQRIRELREHERLVNKQKQREYAQWEHILTTFYPDDNDAEYIEMCETIPVITFGVQIPSVKPSEFELPWFDAKQRERDEQRRMTRRRACRR
ncbi:male-specific lethal 1-like 1 [Diadema antillarum]|uniref:male-specific lethal 1-like 1 n=1 Tax=Diadema antillarum TaxID=105358 RepID=UPI003A8655B3